MLLYCVTIDTENNIILEDIDNYDEKRKQSLYLKSFVNTILVQLDSFLHFLYEQRSKLFIQYIRHLGKNLSTIISEKEDTENITKDILKNYKLIQKDEDLEILRHYKLLQYKIIEVTKIALNLHSVKIRTRRDKVNVTLLDKERGRVIPIYLIALALTNVMERKEALDLYRKFIAHSFAPEDDSKKSTMNMVDEFLDFFKQGKSKTHLYTSFKLPDGRVGVKVRRCMVNEAFKTFDTDFDRSFAYLVSNYPDFYITRRMNENFRLTQSKTIIEGEKYSDFCWHDLRFNETIEHPAEDFWKKIP